MTTFEKTVAVAIAVVLTVVGVRTSYVVMGAVHNLLLMLTLGAIVYGLAVASGILDSDEEADTDTD